MPLPHFTIPGSTYYPLIGAAIDTTATGDITLVAAQANRVIKLWRIWCSAASATELRFKSGSSSLSGNIPVPASGALVLDVSQAPWFTTALGQALVLNNLAGDLNGMIAYTIESVD